MGDTEALWGELIAPEIVRLDNIPLLVFGVSMADEVRVAPEGDIYRFVGVTQRGGHSTYRVMLGDADDPTARARFREIVVLGCGYEQLTPRFVALDVPAHVDIFAVYDHLERGLEDRVWTFEEGHCGHPVDAGPH